jgi:translocation and assembly module TamB
VQVLSGRVKIRRAEYSERTDIATLIAAGNKLNLVTTDLRFGSNVNLDISVDAQDALLIRNNLADVVGTANLKLTGPLTDPLISGRASINRGTVTLRSERYNVLRGLVDLPESRTGQARFDFEADTDLNGFRVIINVVGTLSRFNTTLRSEPSLPQDDIIALITTGQLPAPGVTPQSLESQSRVGAALSLLTDTLSEKVEQRTGRLFGLNRFQIDPLLAARRGSDPTARITLGRRINKDLSLTYSANVTTGQEQIIVIEYQVNRNVSFIGTREQDGSYGFDIRFRKRF